jgi:hypothetical protein
MESEYGERAPLAMWNRLRCDPWARIWRRHFVIMESVMPFPIKVCSICSEEFELKPDKPGFANRCPECSAMDETDATAKRNATQSAADSGLNEARRNAMRDLLYRKE